MPKGLSSKAKKSVQSTLQFSSTPVVIKCTKCLMTYSNTSPSDLLQHKQYHDLRLNGKKWSNSWGDVVTRMEPRKGSPCSNYQSDEYIVMISPKKPKEVKAMLELLTIVNDELNAPHDENAFWSEISESGGQQGKAFVYIKNNRAVGVITVEYIENTHRGKWMVLETKSIVPKVVPDVKLGISRIWVCRNQRNQKIATRLLESARIKSIYGCVVNKWEMAWSQPSQSGSKLAESYNAVKHGSGKLLIPCYI